MTKRALPSPYLPNADGVATTIGINYRADLQIEPVDPDRGAGRVNLIPQVRITNYGRQPVEVRLRGCPVSLRLYPDPYAGGPMVWDHAEFRDRTGARCTQQDYSVKLAPEESEVVEDAIDPAAILGDGVPPGRYRFSVALSLQAEDRPYVEMRAGQSAMRFAADGLAFTSKARVVNGDPRTLEVAVTVTNAGDRDVPVKWGACSLWLRLRNDAIRAIGPAWDEKTAALEGRGIVRSCDDYLKILELGPGKSVSPREFRRVVREADLMGDTLPDSYYEIEASIEVNGVTYDLSPGTVRMVRMEPLSYEGRKESGLQATPGRNDPVQLVRDPRTDAVVHGEVSRDLGDSRTCEPGVGGMVHRTWAVHVYEWLKGQFPADEVLVRVGTHSLRPDCSTGLPTGYPTFLVGEEVVLYLTRDFLGEAPGEDRLRYQYSLVGPYEGKWVTDRGALRNDDPRYPRAEQDTLPWPEGLDVLRRAYR